MKIFLMLFLLFAVCSCSNIRKEDLGLARISPDEKLVEQRKPLVLPDVLIKE